MKGWGMVGKSNDRTEKLNGLGRNTVGMHERGEDIGTCMLNNGREPETRAAAET
jgi:hypothetical protein